MSRFRPARRTVSIASLVVGATVLALAVPGLIAPSGFNWAGDGAIVEAATTESYLIAAPTLIEPDLGLAISSGRLMLEQVRGATLDPAAAATILSGDQARLIVAKATLSLGKPSVFAAPTDGAEQAPLFAALAQLRFERVTFTDSSLSLRLPGGSLETVSALNMVVTRRRAGSIVANGRGSWRGQPVDIAVTATRAMATGTSSGGVDTNIKFKSPIADITFDGRVASGNGLAVDGRSTVAIADIAVLAREFAIRWPQTAEPGPVSFDGSVTWAGGTLAFEKAKFKLGKHRASGALALNTDRPRLLVSGTLDFEALDLAAYIANTPTAASTIDPWLLADWRGRIADLVRVPLARALDVDLRVSASQVGYGATALGPGAASLTLRDGQLKAHVPALELSGGTGTGQLTADFNYHPPRLGLQARLDGMEAAKLSTLVKADGLVQGKATVLLDLQSTGTSLASLRNGAAGTIEVSMRDGARLGVDLLPALAAIEKAPGTAAGGELAKAMARGSTQLEKLEAEVVVQGSMLFCRSAKAAMPGRLIDMSGRLDLDKQTFVAEVAPGGAVDTAPRVIIQGQGAAGSWSAVPSEKLGAAPDKAKPAGAKSDGT